MQVMCWGLWVMESFPFIFSCSVSHVPPAGTDWSLVTGFTTSTAACSANTTDPQHSSTAIWVHCRLTLYCLTRKWELLSFCYQSVPLRFLSGSGPYMYTRIQTHHSVSHLSQLLLLISFYLHIVVLRNRMLKGSIYNAELLTHSQVSP